MDIVNDLGYTAFGQHSGSVGTLSNLSALPRFPVAEAFADMASFTTKAMSLPLPVVQQDPVNPQTDDRRPLLTVRLAPTDANLEQLALVYIKGNINPDISIHYWIIAH